MKNKIILGLVFGIFLIGLVSASITGYLVSRGGGIADAGYTATLQKVEGTTAIVSVQTPTGDTELVRVAEGETAKVGDATISASSLTRGTLFTRGGAEVKIDVAPADEEKKLAGNSAGCSDSLIFGALRVNKIRNSCNDWIDIRAPDVYIQATGQNGLILDPTYTTKISGLTTDLNADFTSIGKNSTDTLQVNSKPYFVIAKGTGNAYACFDTHGRLFRSLTPCI